MTDIPSLSGLKRSSIQVSRNGDQINLYYVTSRPNGKPKKTPLYVKTNCWTCPFGQDDQGKLLVAISDSQYFDVEELDRFGRDVCKYFLKHEGHEIPEDLDNLPYKSLLHHIDGLDVLQMQMSDHTRVFDSNGVKLSPDQANQQIAGQFSGHFLLSLGLRVWSREDSTSQSFYWTIQPIQIKVKRYFTLPEGCKIFDNEEELKGDMDIRKKITIKKRVEDEEAVVDFDPDVNELLD